MKKDISIVIPSIRAKNLKKCYDAISMSCGKRTFEIVIVSPYDLPKELDNLENIKSYKSRAAPTVAAQAGTLLCNSEYLCNLTDDSLAQEGAIHLAISMFENKIVNENGAINMVYQEGVLNPETLERITYHNFGQPPEYWKPYFHEGLRLKGIDKNWTMCPNYLVKLNRFYELGGYDCDWESLNLPIVDFIFRLQADGGKIVNLPKDAALYSHYPGESGDHQPIHKAEIEHDEIRFKEIYSQENIINSRIKQDYANWKLYPNVWKRRF